MPSKAWKGSIDEPDSGDEIFDSAIPLQDAQPLLDSSETTNTSLDPSVYPEDAVSGLDSLSAAEVLPENLPPKPKKKQGASVYMSAYMDNFDEMKDALLFRESPERVGESERCKCGNESSPFHCTECFSLPMMCSSCAVLHHSNLPFHHLRKWNGKFFEKTDLTSLGFILHLGHFGAACPNAIGTGRLMVVVHTNGIHKLHVRFCRCFDVEDREVIVLVRSGLFPATVKQPSTLFTLTVLKEFQVHSQMSKKSAYDYARALQRLENAPFPQDVPNRYDEFMRASRIYEHHTMLRHAGQCHGIDKHLPNRVPGSVRVRCPCCPELDVNVTKEELDLAKDEDMQVHLYCIILSMDANFRLQRKYKRDDPEDISLNGGKGYLAEEAPYKEYLKIAKPENEKCTCSDLRAVRLQNVIKFKNAVVSGVAAVQCARHGFYISAVDLFRGEAFANMDYAFYLALLELKLYRWIMLCYDIWCQYHINLFKRFEQYFEGFGDVIERLRGAIPKGHIRGHIELCQILHCLDYLLYVGKTVGENIESSWGEQDTSAGSTKEMNAGHRHDTLDAMFSSWNFEKLIKMGSRLSIQYIEAVKEVKRQERHHDLFSESQDAALLSKWVAQYDSMTKEGPKKLSSGRVVSVFEMTLPDGVSGPPTEASTFADLVESERVQEFANVKQIGVAQCLKEGLDIEEEQERVRSLAKLAGQDKDSGAKVDKARRRLTEAIEKWRTAFFVHFPIAYVDRVNRTKQSSELINAENDTLELPSKFNEPHRRMLELDSASVHELLLRKGRACDQLDRIRLSVRTYIVNRKFKRVNVHGQGPNTKASDFMKNLLKKQQSAMKVYNLGRQKMLLLGLSEKDTVFRELKKEHLTMKDVTKPGAPGDSKDIDSWIWTAGCPDDLTPKQLDEWTLEATRVQWARSRADRDRAREEAELLKAEMGRNEKTCRKMEEVWTKMGEEHHEHSAGASAYAYKQAAMYQKLAEDAGALSSQALTEGADIRANWDPDEEDNAKKPKHQRHRKQNTHREHSRYHRKPEEQVDIDELSDEDYDERLFGGKDRYGDFSDDSGSEEDEV